jgi:hypothetical protein
VGRSAPTTVTVTLTRGDETLQIARVVSPQCDARVVDVLLRISLEAKRQGWTMRVDGASDELLDLFAFLGLSELLAFASTLEPGGEAELGEELRVEEVVDPGDPPV